MASRSFDAGGNVVAVEGAEWFDLTLLGEVKTGAAWTRHGARPGDLLAVTGAPGRAGAGLRIARALGPGARAADCGEPVCLGLMIEILP